MTRREQIAPSEPVFDPFEYWLREHAADTHALIEQEKNALEMSLLGDPNRWDWAYLWPGNKLAPCAWRERKEPHCRCPRCSRQSEELLSRRSGPCDCKAREDAQKAERQRFRDETIARVREWWATTQDIERMRMWLALDCTTSAEGGGTWAHPDDLKELQAWNKYFYDHKLGSIDHEAIRWLKFQVISGPCACSYRIAPPVQHERLELSRWARNANELRSFVPDPGFDWVDPERAPRDAVFSGDAPRVVCTASWWMRSKSFEDLQLEKEAKEAAERAHAAWCAEQERKKREAERKKKKADERRQREREEDDDEA